MKKIVYSVVLFAAFSFLTSCATIFGGNKYSAHVIVPDHPTASIKYNNELQGYGSAIFKVKRTQAKKLSISVKEEGCEEQIFKFTKNTTRAWPLAYYTLGIVVTLGTGGIPLPWALVVDLANGALVKPNVNEKGISKIDYDNFKYTLEYTGCKK